MNIQPDGQQSISDDQELAKVLAGVTQDDTIAAAAASDPSQATQASEVPETPEVPEVPEAITPEQQQPSEEAPVEPPVPSAVPADTGLASIKQDALSELRPLVDKLNVSPEEKFDTYLLLIRSTDDQSLIGPAHDAAKEITDEARKAQALLDIIKEIDYLTNPQGQQHPAS